jgi:hypothetical protein
METIKPKKEYASKQYFFWNDKPYKVVKEHRRKNIMEAYDIKDDKRVMLPWTDWKRNRKKAFVTSQVAEMLGRHHVRVRFWLIEEKIPRPFSLEDIDGIKRDFGSTKVNYLWSEEDIYRARDYMESTGREDVPSRAQVQAMINNDKLIQYIQGEDGEFYPVWRAQG